MVRKFISPEIVLNFPDTHHIKHTKHRNFDYETLLHKRQSLKNGQHLRTKNNTKNRIIIRKKVREKAGTNKNECKKWV